MNKSFLLSIGIVLGLMTGFFQTPFFDGIAQVASTLFISLLRLVSLPIIFLSIVSTASKMKSLSELKKIGGKVLKYTLITTIIAALVALGTFLFIDPVRVSIEGTIHTTPTDTPDYLKYLVEMVPNNIVLPFSENNVVGVLFLAILFSLATLSLPDENRATLSQFFTSLYQAIMKITSWIIQLMPLAIWAFITLFVRDMQKGLEVQSIAFYLACVIFANLIQAVIVLPLFLKFKGIAPIKLFKAMLPALSIAFFSKSSSAALPMTMQCAQERARVSGKVSQFSLPLCTTINMNACAAFILTTVLFVSMSHGITFSPTEFVIWILLATIGAMGNAAVPMGCYFISSAFLIAMNVPLNILGVILPFYAMIDMLESAINVWSDSCVTAVVDAEVSTSTQQIVASATH